MYPPPVSSVPALSVPYLGIGPGWPTTLRTGHLEIRGLMPSSAKRPREGIQPCYLANSSIEQHNRMFGAVYGEEHVAEFEQARSFLVELNRRREVLYTPEVAHLAFEATVRNFIDLIEEGIRRMSRVTRKGIRRESLAEYALRPRDDGPPAWVCPNSFNVVSTSGFWQEKFNSDCVNI